MLNNKIFYLFSITLLFISQAAQACDWVSGPIVPLVQSVTLKTVVAQREAPIGSTLATQYISTGKSASGYIANCNLGDTGYWKYTGISVPGYQGIYKTNVAGVGIKIEAGTSQFYYSNPAQTYSDDHLSTWAWSDWGVGYNISYVKVGDTSSGDIGSSTTNFQLSNLGVLLTLNIVGGKFSTLACSITTPTLNFPIGDVPLSSFGGSIGTIPSGAQSTQNLGLNCNVGANINVMLRGTQNPDVSISSVLALTGQGNANVAKGVGVQLLYNGTPLKLNNRIVLKQSAGVQETFPITARYYQTKTSVSTGIANASATLDLTYQ